eukprot:gene16165-21978_t
MASSTNSMHLKEDNPYWNIFFLALAWALTLTTSTLLTTIGPIASEKLGASEAFAAFMIGIFLIGAALSSVPSAYIFRKHGRFVGFSIGCFCQLTGSVLGALSLISNKLYILFLGSFFIGLGQGLGQFYRFTVIELTPPELKNTAITYVLSGGIIAAFLGPTAAQNTVDLLGEKYFGSFIIIGLIAILNQITIIMVKFNPPPPTSILFCCSNKSCEVIGESDNSETTIVPEAKLNISQIDNSSNSQSLLGSAILSVAPTQRTSFQILIDPDFALSCTVATIAHTIMIMLMSNISIEVVKNGYSFNNSALVMELHILAMYAPGFITGMFMQKWGTLSIAALGGVLFGASCVVLIINSDLWNFILGMILCGIGWNFSFSAGTVMLTSSYQPIEAPKVQAINDFILFTVAGSSSLIAGYIYSELGWKNLVYVVLVMMVLNLLLFVTIWVKKSKKKGYTTLNNNNNNDNIDKYGNEYDHTHDEEGSVIIDGSHYDPPVVSPMTEQGQYNNYAFNTPNNNNNNNNKIRNDSEEDDMRYSSFVNSYKKKSVSFSEIISSTNRRQLEWDKHNSIDHTGMGVRTLSIT